MNPSRKIYGLIGYPVKHSLSAAMHNAAFQTPEIKNKIEAEYRLFEIEPAKLETFLLDNIKVLDIEGKEFYSQDIIGFNITIPHKVKAREILEKNFPFDKNSPNMLDALYYVKLSGAVNTVKRGVRPLYWNTDAWGFLKSLEGKEEDWDLNFAPKGKSVLVIGCGGAGRAVIASLSWKDLCRKIYVYEKDPAVVNTAQEHFFGQDLSKEWVDLLRQKLEFITEEKIPKTIESCDLLINASPVGMENDEGSVISRHLLEKNKNLSVYDVVYNRQTQLVKDAKSLGLRAVCGLGMLLHQGESAFNLWTGLPAPIEVMKQALKEGVKKV